MYTVAAANQTAMTIIAASGIISPAELNKGDKMNVYDSAGRLLGQTGVVSVAYVNAPPGVGPTTPDPVFQTTFSGYSYLQVSSTSFFLVSPVQIPVRCADSRAHGACMSLPKIMAHHFRFPSYKLSFQGIYPSRARNNL